METPIEQQPSSQNPAQQSASNDLVKLIRKLRWIGMEEEAEHLEVELMHRPAPAADSVLATPRETD